MSWQENTLGDGSGYGVPAAAAIVLMRRSKLAVAARLPLTWWHMWRCLTADPPRNLTGLFARARLSLRLALATTAAAFRHAPR